MNTTTIGDVLSGNTAIKVNVTIDPVSAGLLALALFMGVGLALVLFKKI